MSLRPTVAVLATLCLAHRAGAQDPARITLGTSGASAAQPGLVVLAGRGIDSVRAIVQRDLTNSDRFTMAQLSDSLGTLRAPFDPASLKGLNYTWAVELQPALNGVDVKLYDLATGTVRQQATRPADLSGVGDTRMTIHRISDLIVGWTGGVGMAATRISFKGKNGADDAIWRIDSDGANQVRVTPRGPGFMMSPAWNPDGSSIAYSENRDGRWTLYVQKLASGTRTAVTSSSSGDSYGGNFSPDGRAMVFSHALPGGGTGIETVDVRQNCCAHLLTADRRLADNVSPSYSHDGRRIAYISSRTGSTQVYVMDEDGSSQEQLVATRFTDAGRPLDANSPAWSPDGTKIAFARDTDHGFRQVFTSSVTGGVPGQLTSGSQNEDPSWAPDSRHLVFKSKRSGREQLWIIDIESGASRQLTNVAGEARFPAWSRALGTNP